MAKPVPTNAPKIYLKSADAKYSTPQELANILAPAPNALGIDPTTGKLLVTPPEPVDPGGCEVTVKNLTANYTLTAADAGSLIYVDSATPVTITAPAGLPAGFIAQVYQKGAGQVTVVGGAGNTLRSANGFKTRVQHSAIGISYESTALSNITGDSTV